MILKIIHRFSSTFLFIYIYFIHIWANQKNLLFKCQKTTTLTSFKHFFRLSSETFSYFFPCVAIVSHWLYKQRWTERRDTKNEEKCRFYSDGMLIVSIILMTIFIGQDKRENGRFLLLLFIFFVIFCVCVSFITIIKYLYAKKNNKKRNK